MIVSINPGNGCCTNLSRNWITFELAAGSSFWPYSTKTALSLKFRMIKVVSKLK